MINKGDIFVCVQSYGSAVKGQSYTVTAMMETGRCKLSTGTTWWYDDSGNPNFFEIFQPSKENLFDVLYKRMTQ